MMRGFVRIPALMVAVCALTQCERISQALDAGKDGGASGNAAIIADDGNFDEIVADSSRVVVVDFHADWCGPCRKLSPVLERTVAGYDGQVVLAKVDVDEHKGLAAKHGVRSIPDVRIYRDGRKQDGFVGNIAPDDIRRKLDAQVARLASGDAEGAETTETGGEAEAAIQPMPEDWLPPGIERR